MGAYRKRFAWTVGIIEKFKILRDTVTVSVNVICFKDRKSVHKTALRNVNVIFGAMFLKKTFRDVERDRILNLDLQ